MGALKIIYILIIILGLGVQFLLYKDKAKTKTSIYILNMLFAILLSYLAYTSFPINYMAQKIITIAFGLISILGVGLKLMTENTILVSKLLISISIIGNLLMFFN